MHDIIDIDTIVEAFSRERGTKEFCPTALGLRSAFEQLVEEGFMVRVKKMAPNGYEQIFYQLAE